MNLNDSIAAPATLANNQSPLAIIRISGKNLKKLYFKLTKKKNPKTHYATKSNIYHLTSKHKLDESVVIYYKTPKSFTGEDIIEVICHGGKIIQEEILNSLYEFGVRAALPGEFSYRAFINGKIDLIQAENINDYIQNVNRTQTKNYLKNIGGYLTNQVQKIKNKTLNLLTIIEHELDFSEDEITATSLKNIKKGITTINSMIKDILKNSLVGKDSFQGLRIMLIGNANSGKSTLFNRLIGFDKAIVSSEAGTTRDYIEHWIKINNLDACLIDTAGLMETTNIINKKSIQKTKKQLRIADVLIVLDPKNPNLLFKKLIKKINFNEKNVILVQSKCDKKTPKTEKTKTIQISSLNGLGIDKLLTKLSTVINAQGVVDENRFVIKERHLVLLKRGSALLDNINILIKNSETTDIISSQLYLFLDTIDELTGQVNPDNIIKNIFNNFCVGK